METGQKKPQSRTQDSGHSRSKKSALNTKKSGIDLSNPAKSSFHSQSQSQKHNKAHGNRSGQHKTNSNKLRKSKYNTQQSNQLGSNNASNNKQNRQKNKQNNSKTPTHQTNSQQRTNPHHKPTTRNPNTNWSNSTPHQTRQQSQRHNKTAKPHPSAADTKLVLFNKPYQVLCQFSADGDKETLADYMHIPEIYPAGRLDYESEGLLLLTNNGRLQHKISHPTKKIAKTYAVQVEGIPTEEQLTTLRNGVKLKDGITKPAIITLMTTAPTFPEREPPIRHRQNKPDSWIEITITEGRNKQIRRMTATVGLPTLRLIRTQIDRYKLGNLEPGEWHLLKNIKI